MLNYKKLTLQYFYFIQLVGQFSKKRMKFLPIGRTSGDIIGGRQSSWTYIVTDPLDFIQIHRPNYGRIMWQDPALTQWEGAHSRMLIESLESKHDWVGEDDLVTEDVSEK